MAKDIFEEDPLSRFLSRPAPDPNSVMDPSFLSGDTADPHLIYLLHPELFPDGDPSPASGTGGIPLGGFSSAAPSTLPATAVPSVAAAPSAVGTSGALTAGVSKAMDPLTMYLLMGGISAGTGILGSAMQAGAQNNATQLSAQEFQQQRQDTQKQLMSQFLQGIMQQKQNLQTTQAGQGLASTQMDPYAQAKALNTANIKRSFGAGYVPGAGFTGSFDTSALAPTALAGANDQFQKYAAAAQPNVPVTSPGAEAFRQQNLASTTKTQDDLQAQILEFLRQFGGGQPGAHVGPSVPGTAAQPRVA